MRRALPAVALLFALAASLAPTVAQSDGDFQKERAQAIDKGIAWLRKAQAADGSWDYEERPFAIMGEKGAIHMKQGTTALCAYALLKAGVFPDDPQIKKAFDFILGCQIEHVYSAGCVLLAI